MPEPELTTPGLGGKFEGLQNSAVTLGAPPESGGMKEAPPGLVGKTEAPPELVGRPEAPPELEETTGISSLTNG